MTRSVRIDQLLLGTLHLESAADRSDAAPVPVPGQPGSLRNHATAPPRRNGRPKLLGHDGFPAGLSNGKKPETPAR